MFSFFSSQSSPGAAGVLPEPGGPHHPRTGLPGSVGWLDWWRGDTHTIPPRAPGGCLGGGWTCRAVQWLVLWVVWTSRGLAGNGTGVSPTSCHPALVTLGRVTPWRVRPPPRRQGQVRASETSECQEPVPGVSGASAKGRRALTPTPCVRPGPPGRSLPEPALLWQPPASSAPGWEPLAPTARVGRRMRSGPNRACF